VASTFYDLVRVYTATTGTGAITLGSAVPGFLTFAGAGVPNGATVTYGIVEGNNREVGTGVYSSGMLTLTRSVAKSTNSNNPISLAGSAQVFLTLSAEDLAAIAASIVTASRPWYWSPPPASKFSTTIGAVAPTLTDDASVGLIFNPGTAVTGDVSRAVLCSLPAAGTDFTVAAHLNIAGLNASYCGTGLCLYDSISANRIIHFKREFQNSNIVTNVGYFNLPTGYSSSAIYFNTIGDPPSWFKISRTSTTLTFSLSWDGKLWITFGTASETAWLAHAPTHVGLGAWYNTAYLQVGSSCDYWYQTW